MTHYFCGPLRVSVDAQTHALNGIRAGVAGAQLGDVTPDLWWLLLASIILLPLALWVFGGAVNRAKFDGTLAQY